MRKTVTTFCILTPLLWKNVVTELWCSVTTVYRASCCGTLVWKCSVSSDELANQLVKICLRSVLTTAEVSRLTEEAEHLERHTQTL